MSKVGSSDATRPSLLGRARMRDELAWFELVELYSPLVIGWCRRCRVDAETTADCVQEVFSSVAKSLPEFRETGVAGAFRGWLWIIVRNKLRDLLRREARQCHAQGGSTAYGQLAEVVDPNSIPEDEPSDAHCLRLLNQRGLKQIESSFAPQTWTAFTRTVIEGVPTDIVARELNLTPATVRQARCRVLRKLRQQLGDLN